MPYPTNVLDGLRAMLVAPSCRDLPQCILFNLLSEGQSGLPEAGLTDPWRQNVNLTSNLSLYSAAKSCNVTRSVSAASVSDIRGRCRVGCRYLQTAAS